METEGEFADPIPELQSGPVTTPAVGNELALEEPIQYVTLDQAAAMVSQSKRTLERYKEQMPEPSVRGGGRGKPDEWDWAVLRLWLEKHFDRPLPDRYPNRHRKPT